MSKSIELQEISEYDEFENKDLLEKSLKSSLSAAELTLFTYDVDKSSSNWVVTFNQWSKIRHHTSRGYAPYMEYNLRRNDNCIVKPNQWLEGLVDGSWSRLSDADHR